MQNDVLKNEIAPWQEKGRWYHVSVESDGVQWKINFNKSDKIFIGSTISANILLTSISYDQGKLVDLKAILRARPLDVLSVRYNCLFLRLAPASQGVNLAPVASYVGEIDLWLFVYEN